MTTEPNQRTGTFSWPLSININDISVSEKENTIVIAKFNWRHQKRSHVLLLCGRVGAAGAAGAEIGCGQVHQLRLARWPRWVREGSEALLLSRVAVAREGTSLVLRQLQVHVPSVVLPAAAAGGIAVAGGGAGRPALPVLRSGGGGPLQVLPLLRLRTVSVSCLRGFGSVVSCESGYVFVL